MKRWLVIKRDREFQQILKINRKIITVSYLLFYRSSRGARNRFGIAVSKQYGSVVTKNRVKRQVRAMLTLICGQRHDQGAGVDVIVMVRKGYFNSDFQTNLRMLRRGLQAIPPLV